MNICLAKKRQPKRLLPGAPNLTSQRRLLNTVTTKRYIMVGDILYLPTGPEFVSAPYLAYLYGLPRQDCIFVDINRPQTLIGLPKLPKLYPRYDGNYKLPEDMVWST